MTRISAKKREELIQSLLKLLENPDENLSQERGYAAKIINSDPEIIGLAKKVKLMDNEKFRSLAEFIYDNKQISIQRLKKIARTNKKLTIKKTKLIKLEPEKIGKDIEHQQVKPKTIRDFINYGKNS